MIIMDIINIFQHNFIFETDFKLRILYLVRIHDMYVEKNNAQTWLESALIS